MSTPEWKWTQVRARIPADGQTVAIKFADANDAVCYGIGWYNVREKSWVVTAEPNMFEGVLVPIEWVAAAFTNILGRNSHCQHKEKACRAVWTTPTAGFVLIRFDPFNI